MFYKYETHLHSSPASKCASASVEDSLKYYKKLGYSGVFLTNHFLNGNTGAPKDISREKQLEFYCRDYFEGVKLTHSIGINLFFGVELTFDGRTDFLVYGLSPEFYLEHPEILDFSPAHTLEFLSMHGAYIVHAHPFREKDNSCCLSLYPRLTDAVEIFNGECFPEENKMAEKYADNYGFAHFAGSDNHTACEHKNLGGIKTTVPIESEKDFVDILKSKKYKLFY